MSPYMRAISARCGWGRLPLGRGIPAPAIIHGGTELVQEGVMLDELTPNARTVLAELGPKAQTADDLAAATGLAVQAVLAALMELEFAGAAVDNGGGRYTAA